MMGSADQSVCVGDGTQPEPKARPTEPASRSIAADYIPMHGASAPVWEVKKEQPWHRYALHLMARAKMSATEVAKIVQCSPDTIRNLTKQPWFREQYDRIVQNRVDSMYDQLLEGEDVHSLLTLITIRDDTKAPAAVRSRCAFDILDRMHGKAVQTIKSESTIISRKEDVESLQAEMVQLEQEERELFGAIAPMQKLGPGETNRE